MPLEGGKQWTVGGEPAWQQFTTIDRYLSGDTNYVLNRTAHWAALHQYVMKVRPYCTGMSDNGVPIGTWCIPVRVKEVLEASGDCTDVLFLDGDAVVRLDWAVPELSTGTRIRMAIHDGNNIACVRCESSVSA